MTSAGHSTPGEVTELLLSWRRGDPTALDRLTPLIYRHLRRLAAAQLRRERRDHTLQPTALVHEAYLHMIDEMSIEFRDRAHFFALAATIMRRILVNHAKRRAATKRIGGNRITLVENLEVLENTSLDLIAVNEALESLSQVDERLGLIVEMRFFGGLTEDEIADILQVSVRTVKREWRAARTILHGHLSRSILD